MKILTVTFVLILALNEVDISCTQSEFVTIMTPKFVRQNEPLNIFYTINKAVDGPIDITLKYRKDGLTQGLDDDLRMKEIKFQDNKNLKNNELDVNIMLSRSKNKQSTKMCMTKKMVIKTEKKIHKTFIQFDKPVYKPGDKVQFRVIVLDSNLKLLHMNNLDIEIIDPIGNRFKVTSDLTNRTLMVIEEKYQLTSEVIYGDWKVEVTVDKEQEPKASKSFAVQKYVLPPFEVFITTNEKHYHKSSYVDILFYGRYSFEEYVIGKAQLIITKKAGNSTEVVYKSDFSIKENFCTYKWRDSKFKGGIDTAEYEAYVSLKEPQSGYESNATTTFFIHNEQKFKIIPVHPKNFQTGMPFLIKVWVTDWKDNFVNSDTDSVKIKIIFTDTENALSTIFDSKPVSDGVVSSEQVINKNVTNVYLEISFKNSYIYRADIKQGVNIIIRGFIISHLPERPKFGETVEISVKSDLEIEKLFVIYTTQNGNVEKDTIDCKKVKICRFTTTIDEKKMPSFTVSVFQIISRSRITTGKTTIATETLKQNLLKLEVPKHAEPFKKSAIKFNSANSSRVYVLAFDKRLTYLGKGNDVTKNDVQQAYEDYDGENNYLMIDLSIDESWKECTPVELRRIEKGRPTQKQHTSSSDSAVFLNENYTELETASSESEQNGANTNIDKVREEFPETWIFESFDIVGGQEKNFNVKVPHSITTWMISAFAINRDTAIAIAQPQELIVKIDFFIKINLPYSIRYKEILRVDILVYNYVKLNETLIVDVQLENLNKMHPITQESIKEFEFMKNNGNTCSFNQDNSESKKASVKKGTVKKISFYIRSNPDDMDNTINRKILLQARAVGRDPRGKTYKDAVRKRLLVEQVGILEQEIETSIFKLNGNTSTANVTAPASYLSYPKTSVFIRGDLLSEKMELDVDKTGKMGSKFFPEGCADQRTSGMKGTVEYYRYLKMKNENTSVAMEHINYYYSILTRSRSTSTLDYWTYQSSSSYISFFTDIFVSAMEVGAFDFSTFNRDFIEQDFDKLIQYQSENGNFSCTEYAYKQYEYGYGLTTCIYPRFLRDRDPTEQFFDTAYPLISLLKYKNLLESNGMSLNSSYQNVIDLGFTFLDSSEKDTIDFDAMALIAYAYALNDDKNKAKSILDKINNAKIIHPGNKKCYRINLSTSSCDFEMTVFVALAYITLNQTSDAEPIIEYILENHYQNQYYSNTYQYAIATEAIAKVAGAMKNVNTNIHVTMSNERTYLKSIQITNDQITKYNEISIPEYTRTISFNVTGHGYCAITTVLQFRNKVNQSVPFFHVNVTPYVEINVVKVCTKYTSTDHPERLLKLVNVIYEIETPSGFTFDSVVDLENHKEYLRDVEERNKKTLVILYFDQFDEGRNYCVNVTLLRSFPVINAAAAGVKVYDYEHKNHFASEFYKMNTDQC